MQTLSEAVEKAIEKSGGNITQIATLAKIDRSLLSKFKNGERNLNEESFGRLVAAFASSPREKDELFELYKMEKEEKSEGYHERKEVISLINSINEASKRIPKKEVLLRVTDTLNTDNIEMVESFSTGIQIRNIIQTIIKEEIKTAENPTIEFSIPFEYGFVYELLLEFYLEYTGDLKIRTVFNVAKDSTDPNKKSKSLNALKYCMPFLFSGKIGYEPHYYYSASNSEEDASLIFPYYLITKKAVVLLTADFSQALLLRNPHLVEIYKKEFQKILSKSKLFYKRVDEKLLIYDELTYYNDPKLILEPLPCVAYFVTKERIESLIHKNHEHRKELVKMATDYYASYHKNKTDNESFFSIVALNTFVENGILLEFGTDDCRPFNISERIQFLKMVQKNLKSKNIHFYGLREEIIENEGPFEILQMKNSAILIRCFEEKKTTLTAVYIDEINLCGVFENFFKYLKSGNLLYTIEEMLEILGEMIERLEKSKDE